MKRYLVLAYGVVNYLLFFATFLYLTGFVGNFAVANSLDAPAQGPLWLALVVNAALVAVFALQHSVMARPAFKRWITQYLPQPIERSTYMLFTNLALALLMWQWRPMGGIVWDVQHPIGRGVIYAVFALGLLIVFGSSCLINHFDLFGLRQVWLYFCGKPYMQLRFATPGPYQWIRHPLYIGWMTAFWAAPTMTVAHLLFAAGMTAYMLVAIWFEERDLLRFHGADYATYRQNVPMLVPKLSRKSAAHRPAVQSAKPVSL